MRLADISIRNPVFAWMLMALLIVFGSIAFTRMGVSQMPDVDFPNVTINVTLEGASPEIMETDVVDVIEDAVMSVEGIREINSTSRQGQASVSIEFELSRSIDAAIQDVQSKLAQAQRLLPREIDPPIVTKQNPEDQPILWVALSGNVPLPVLMETARFSVKNALQTAGGVGEISLGGYLDRNLRVWLKLDEMESRQIAVDDVVAALQREHVEVPAGRIETPEREMPVRAMGEAPSVAEFKKIVITYRNGSPVFLEDVATIEDGLADLRRVSRVNGAPAVGLGIRKQRGHNAVQVARNVREQLPVIAASLPPGLELGVNFDSTKFVEESIEEIEFTLVLSIILTAIVCWLFLGSWSSTFNILLSIPTSIIGSLIFLQALGFTLNTFTLLGLSLAVGIVVDDAIMVLENIVRHREMGEGKAEAASRGAREITGAAVAATLALIAIFLPIALMRGIMGKFLFQFGVTMSVAVALSLLEALTLTPMRCAATLSVGERSSWIGRKLEGFFHGLAKGYGRILAPCLRYRWLVLLLSTAGFAGSLTLMSRLNAEIMPAQDQSVFMVRMQTPVGSSLNYTDGRMRLCEEFMQTRPEVKRAYVAVGGFGGGEVDTGIMFITLHPPGARGPANPTQGQFMDVVRRQFNSVPGLRAYPSDLSMRGLTPRGSQFAVQFSLTGPEFETLAACSDRMMARMRETGLMVDVNDDYLVGLPEVEIRPDRERAADLGVSMSSIGTSVNALIGGVRAAKFTDDGHRFDVRVRLASEERSRPDDVKRIFVRSRDGRLVHLSDVVRVSQQPAVQTITRRNRERSITVSANLAPGKSQKEALDRIEEAAKAELPPGYRMSFTGTAALFQEAFLAFIGALGLGVLVAYMVLASQFNSYVHPLLILLAMPFSVTGAILAMLWAGVSFNMFSMIGIILLMGIVKKNSILLVEFTNQVRATGKPVREALLEACPIRLRPILMTSFATIAAALPPALAIGPGAETRIPMAVVIIGGVLLSTVLTLFVVPCAYSILPGRERHKVELPA